MKILFIQLPLIDHSYSYIYGNIEYAASSISGYIRKNSGKNIETFQLPFILSAFGSDSLILKYIFQLNPEIVCFSCYLWNIERNMNIARGIKEINSELQIIFGGPEISNGSYSLSEKVDYIDSFVSGEGEWFFKHFLLKNNLDKYLNRINGNFLYIQPEKELIPAIEIFEPYSGKMLDPMIDGTVYLELTRGCPYRCTYCFYSKNCKKVRELPFQLLLDTIKDGKNLNEIYILAPAFNRSADFINKLKQLAQINKRIKLHSEMRASDIDKNIAKLLQQAGFHSMEVGLQTLSRESLKKVQRNSDPDLELKGMEALKNAGIDLKIGLIPGLPEDDFEGFINTIDRLIELGFRDEIELYPLMILPGTKILDDAVNSNVDFLNKPPYYYHSGWGFSFNNMTKIREYIETKTGYSMSVKNLPDFTISDNGLFYNSVIFEGDNLNYWKPELYFNSIETNVFNFHITVSTSKIIYDKLGLFLHGLPESELFNIIFYSNVVINEKIFIKILSHDERDNFYRRLNIYNEWGDGLRYRFFQVISEPEIFNQCDSTYSLIEPIFHIKKSNIATLGFFTENTNLLISKGLLSKIYEILIDRYSSAPELVAFESEKEMAEFYNMIGHEHIEFPFSFKMQTI